MTNLPISPSAGPVTTGPRPAPLQVVCRRLRRGLYKLCGAGVTAIIGGSFLIKLTALAIVAGISTSLLLGALGLLVELIESSCFPVDTSE